MSYKLTELRKYKLNIEGKIYLIFVKDEEDLTKFYIQKETYGMILFMIGSDLEELGDNEEGFIEDNINDWVYSYEKDLEKLERCE